MRSMFTFGYGQKSPTEEQKAQFDQAIDERRKQFEQEKLLKNKQD